MKKLIKEVPLYGVGSIEIYTDAKSADRRAKSLGIAALSDCAGCCCWDTLYSHGVLIVVVLDGSLNTACHEALHATSRYMDFVGIPAVSGTANEAWAYFHGWIAEQVVSTVLASR